MRFWSDDGVQAGVLAGPGQLYIQPVDVLGAGEADQGPSAGQTLGAVAGGGVGQVDPPVALAAAAAVQVGPGQGHLPAVGAVQADGEGPGVGVEGGDDPPAVVGHPQLADGVVATHDPVPHPQLAVLNLQPRLAVAFDLL